MARAGWGHVREQFNNPFFRAHCRRLLGPVLDQLAEYAAHPEKFRLLGVLGVDGSPSCGAFKTCTGDWGGEPFCAGIQRKLSPACEAQGPAGRLPGGICPASSGARPKAPILFAPYVSQRIKVKEVEAIRLQSRYFNAFSSSSSAEWPAASLRFFEPAALGPKS